MATGAGTITPFANSDRPWEGATDSTAADSTTGGHLEALVTSSDESSTSLKVTAANTEAPEGDSSNRPAVLPTLKSFSFLSLQQTGSPAGGAFLTYSPTPACHGADPEKCGCASANQADYRGTISVTEDGMPCLRWDSDAVKRRKRFYWESFPDAGLEGNSFCRN
eukprot:CAMPEP_0172556086 /NCGR_PEP_ID=MMETSP1067-20121228/63233_1 /TAXON_ID=265564 ORGANISM="Thalassiosira punctigera, Strain Tpunct2005C2" /NCGR_SAMPLE_ID=MMETSP1067 /ASSEMBLY_ACC=CAM_ASM_000444 /LENGTH=164 /DNA_ID=CAMNT_0013344783 /DNA_START=15 /DNA_END=506 /DNA_ORIENTATION=+